MIAITAKKMERSAVNLRFVIEDLPFVATHKRRFLTNSSNFRCRWSPMEQT